MKMKIQRAKNSSREVKSNENKDEFHDLLLSLSLLKTFIFMIIISFDERIKKRSWNSQEKNEDNIIPKNRTEQREKSIRRKSFWEFMNIRT